MLPAFAHAQVADGYSITGVISSPDGNALSYSTVVLRETGRERFANERGDFRFTGLRAGTFHLRFRQLGYTARDTAITLGSAYPAPNLRITLQPIAFRLTAVVVKARTRGCVVSGPEAIGADPDLGVILTEVSKNAEREVVLRNEYPFEYTLSQRFETDRAEGGRRISSSTRAYDSRNAWLYRPGNVVAPDEPSNESSETIVHLPELIHLADTVFQSSHCYTYAGIVDDRGSKAHRIDFRPLDRIETADVEGSVFLDRNSFLIRRVEFRLTKPDRLSTPVLGVTATTFYREILPTIVLIDEIRSVQPLRQMSVEYGALHANQIQKLTKFRFLGISPGDVH